MINQVIKRTLVAAQIPAILEPAGMFRSDGKRPDGVSMIPWSRGKLLVWDATVSDTLAPSLLRHTRQRAGAAAQLAVLKKRHKYSTILPTHNFVAFAMETFGSFSYEAALLVASLGRRLAEVTGDSREVMHLRQRLSIAVMTGNAASVLGTMTR